MTTERNIFNLHIPGYTILEKLGIGAMAKVYLAIQENLDRKVALKIMSDSLLSDSEFKVRFVQEAKIVAQLSHPNIISVYDVGAYEDNYFLAMEYHNGGDLKQKLKHGISFFDAITYATQIASALDFAHAEGYVHRDVKPENILFDRNGNAILTDFGIAVSGKAKSKMTAAGTVIGTPKYMSPEQARGDKLDGRSDLYSLGVIIYEMLTGQVPYNAENPIAICQMHIAKEIPRLPKEIACFQGLIDACMAKFPEDRINTGREVVNLLTEAEKNTELLARRNETYLTISRDLVHNVDFRHGEKTEVTPINGQPLPLQEQKTAKIDDSNANMVGPKGDQPQAAAIIEPEPATDIIRDSQKNIDKTSSQNTHENGKSLKIPIMWLGASVISVTLIAITTYLIANKARQNDRPSIVVTQQAVDPSRVPDKIASVGEVGSESNTLAEIELTPQVTTESVPMVEPDSLALLTPPGSTTSEFISLLKSVNIISPKTLSLCNTNEPYMMGYQIVSDRDTLNKGGCFSIQLESVKTVDLTVYAHSEDGTIYRLLPNECNAMGIDGLNISPNQIINFPVNKDDNLAVIGLDEKAGREWVYTIATTDTEARQKVLSNLVDVPDVCTGEGGSMSITEVQKKLNTLASQLQDRMQWIASSFNHSSI